MIILTLTLLLWSACAIFAAVAILRAKFGHQTRAGFRAGLPVRAIRRRKL